MVEPMEGSVRAAFICAYSASLGYTVINRILVIRFPRTNSSWITILLHSMQRRAAFSGFTKFSAVTITVPSLNIRRARSRAASIYRSLLDNPGWLPLKSAANSDFNGGRVWQLFSIAVSYFLLRTACFYPTQPGQLQVNYEGRELAGAPPDRIHPLLPRSVESFVSAAKEIIRSCFNTIFFSVFSRRVNPTQIIDRFS